MLNSLQREQLERCIQTCRTSCACSNSIGIGATVAWHLTANAVSTPDFVIHNHNYDDDYGYTFVNSDE